MWARGKRDSTVLGKVEVREVAHSNHMTLSYGELKPSLPTLWAVKGEARLTVPAVLRRPVVF